MTSTNNGEKLTKVPCRLYVNLGKLAEGQSITEYIEEHLSQNKGNYTRKERGIILDITSVEVSLGEIGYSGAVSSYVTFDARTFLPSENMELEAELTKSLPTGGLFSYKGLMNIWVREEQMRPLVYQDGIYTHPEEIRSLKLGDSCKIEINLVRYEQKTYSCIGSYIS